MVYYVDFWFLGFRDFMDFFKYRDICNEKNKYDLIFFVIQIYKRLRLFLSKFDEYGNCFDI